MSAALNLPRGDKSPRRAPGSGPAEPAGRADGHTRLLPLLVAALGVVYGDIGTSPLYALREVFSPVYGVTLSEAHVLGILSLVLWALIFVVSIKYVALILRADNQGEGGVMAMIALASGAVDARWRRGVILLGLVGAALFFGEGVITPAISVLSAIEGLEVVTDQFSPLVVPLTLIVLTILYLVQKHGTEAIGAWFGPVMVVWFAVLALLGAVQIVQQPVVLLAFDPRHALAFVLERPGIAFVVLGAVVLTITGAEALYADLGHFGRRPIRLSWFGCVFPALVLNYLGQGALLLTDPAAIANPFYRMAPSWALLPLVVLATAATVIAAQATISATFSVARQAMQLGYVPRFQVVHTSASTMGQIYMPAINWVQYALVVAGVLAFGSSSNLAAAYGIAVTGTMLVNTLLTFFVVRCAWKMNLALALAATALFAAVDFAFLSSNTLKLLHGGWFPLLLGSLVYFLMLTWLRGRDLVARRQAEDEIPVRAFMEALLADPPLRVPGTAVFLRGITEGVPRAMLHNLAHNKVLHARIVLVTVRNAPVPAVAASARARVESLGLDCWQVTLTYGFKEQPDVPAALVALDIPGLSFEPLETTYFVSRKNVIAHAGDGWQGWRDRIYAAMVLNAGDAADFFMLPTNRVVQMGALVEL